MPQYVLMLLEDESWEERSDDDRKKAYAAIALAKSWPGGDVEVRPIVVH